LPQDISFDGAAEEVRQETRIALGATVAFGRTLGHTKNVRADRHTKMANHPKPSAKNVTGDFGQFTSFMRRLVAVPHSEIKAKLDAEKRAKKRKRKAASRASSAKD
jgi:hypothetical protein